MLRVVTILIISLVIWVLLPLPLQLLIILLAANLLRQLPLQQQAPQKINRRQLLYSAEV